jgi:hypothetical protein
VFILHPGFLNQEAGPDFRAAQIQVADRAPQTGDIEIDPRPSDWLQHGHAGNPAYADVVLHVVWRAPDGPPVPANLPLLELAPVLDAPLGELSEWLAHAAAETSRFVRGNCAAPLQHLGETRLEPLLQQAALFRLETRAARIGARAREAGWDQALWEGCFRALGYKHNSWPMQRLAELRSHWATRHASAQTVLARLLGLSGLLPTDAGTGHNRSTHYLRELWDAWWRDRDAFQTCALPAGSWRLSGLRPANHPQRRLALAAHWIAEGDLPDKLVDWCATRPTGSQLPGSLLQLLKPASMPYWSRHHTLGSRPSLRDLPLLGISRVTDLAANIILPWLWARAQQGRRLTLRQEIERRYLAWPTGADNALLRQARQRLLGGKHIRRMQRLALQQGLLQIAGDFCSTSNSLCERCRFPEVVHQWNKD